MRTFEEGMVIYSALIAEPATGKSPAMTIIRKALIDVDKYFETPNENSKLVNGNSLIEIKFRIYYQIYYFQRQLLKDYLRI